MGVGLSSPGGSPPLVALAHLTTPATWRVALEAGSLVAPSLVVDGFVHLSTPEQVHLPAQRLLAGRDDVLLLVIDPQRLPSAPRWEPGVPGDPASMRFPHLYSALPAAAVTSVVPYRPGPDGYGPPPALPGHIDFAARARAFDVGLAQRRAAAVLPVESGFAAVDPRVPASWEHNSLWLTGDVAVDVVRQEANRTLEPGRTRRVVFDRPPPVGAGWEVDEERILVLGPDVEVAPTPPMPVVVHVTREVMHGLWGPSWRRDIPGIDAAAVEDLLRREGFADAHLRVIDLAVLDDGGVPMAGTQLRIDGATAAIESVMTDPGARGRGFATALVLDAVHRARAAGCDLVWLIATAEDWPRQWYERLGFADVGARWVATWSPT